MCLTAPSPPVYIGLQCTRAKRFNMQSPVIVITDRSIIACADNLIAAHGGDAARVARSRAEASRRVENVHDFCRWRHVERLIASLAASSVNATIH